MRQIWRRINKKHIFIIVNIVILLASATLLISRNVGRERTVTSDNESLTTENDRTHIPAASRKYGGPEPPTSGPHASPMQWEAYDADVDDANAIHNLEHGGIYLLPLRSASRADRTDQSRFPYTFSPHRLQPRQGPDSTAINQRITDRYFIVEEKPETYSFR